MVQHVKDTETWTETRHQDGWKCIVSFCLIKAAGLSQKVYFVSLTNVAVFTADSLVKTRL